MQTTKSKKPKSARPDHPRLTTDDSRLPDRLETILIERVSPELDSGRYPVKREVGDRLEVTADIFKEGHDQLTAVLRYRDVADPEWHERPMELVENDRWRGWFDLTTNTRYRYTIAAWVATFASWRQEIEKKMAVQTDLGSELLEGQALVRAAASRAEGADRRALEDALTRISGASGRERLPLLLREDLAILVAAHEERIAWTAYPRELEVVCDRITARCGAWYEMFPRSQGTLPGRSATFDDCVSRLPSIREMGFDVLYLPPIHPIGR